jgi:endonuclease/exonuclease/phosphatase family metal-dependent hydrolase
MRRAPALLLALAASSCGDDEPVPSVALRVMTFNVMGSARVAEPEAGAVIAAQIEALAPDVVAVQECGDCAPLLDRLPTRYAQVTPDGPDGLFYDATRFAVIADGLLPLGENDDGWGARGARWARLMDAAGGIVTVYSTHWCVTVRSPDDRCDVARQLAYAETLLDDIGGADATIVAGDLNVFDGYAGGEVIAALRDGGLHDAIVAAAAPPLDTFQGKDWAPAGRIDYVLVSRDVVVAAAGTDQSVEASTGSDHYPVWADVTTRAR